MTFNIIDFFKFIFQNPIKSTLPLLFASGLILFSPNSLISSLYMTTFKEKYGFLVGALFILSLVMLCCNILFSICKFFKKAYSNIQFKKNSSKILANLELPHKIIVYFLYNKNNHTLELPLNDGIIRYLEYANIIVKTTNQYVTNNIRNPKFPYMLQPWVIEKLQSNKELFESFKHEINTNEVYVRNFFKEIYS